MSSFQFSLVARSVRSRITPAWTSSSAWRPWLNCVAPIGSPPVMRLIMTGRATSPDPGMAPSTHLLPVAEFAKAFNATGNKWVDGAIPGSGDVARPVMISRITGGDPMGATQFNHGRQAEELVQAGVMRDLTDLATKAVSYTHLTLPTSDLV